MSSNSTHESQWIADIQDKLKQRSLCFLRLKLAKVTQINEREFEVATRDQILEHAKSCLFALINEWRGIQTSRLRSAITDYNDYYRRSKHWWDQTKKRVFGTVFWLPVLTNIHANTESRQKFMTVLHAILDQHIRYQNCKHPLLNTESITRSPELQRFLSDLDDSLTIAAWMEQQKNATRSNRDDYHCHATTVIKKLKSQILQNLAARKYDQAICEQSDALSPQSPVQNVAASNDMYNEQQQHAQSVQLFTVPQATYDAIPANQHLDVSDPAIANATYRRHHLVGQHNLHMSDSLPMDLGINQVVLPVVLPRIPMQAPLLLRNLHGYLPVHVPSYRMYAIWQNAFGVYVRPYSPY